MTDRFIDFDAARAERVEEPLLLRAYGQTFELPGSMPASVLLDIVRLQEELSEDAEVSAKDAHSLLRRMLPEEVLDELLEHEDFSTDDFTELVKMVMSAYVRGGAEGEQNAPNRAARRDSSAKSHRPRGSHAGSNGQKAKKARPGRASSSSGT